MVSVSDALLDSSLIIKEYAELLIHFVKVSIKKMGIALNAMLDSTWMLEHALLMKI